MNGSRNRVLIDAGEAWRWSCAVLAKPFKGGLQLTVSQSGQCRTDQTDRQFPLPRARGETVRSRLPSEEQKPQNLACVKYWEIIADILKKAGWS